MDAVWETDSCRHKRTLRLQPQALWQHSKLKSEGPLSAIAVVTGCQRLTVSGCTDSAVTLHCTGDSETHMPVPTRHRCSYVSPSLPCTQALAGKVPGKPMALQSMRPDSPEGACPQIVDADTSLIIKKGPLSQPLCSALASGRALHKLEDPLLFLHAGQPWVSRHRLGLHNLPHKRHGYWLQLARCSSPSSLTPSMSTPRPHKLNSM